MVVVPVVLPLVVLVTSYLALLYLYILTCCAYCVGTDGAPAHWSGRAGGQTEDSGAGRLTLELYTCIVVLCTTKYLYVYIMLGCFCECIYTSVVCTY